MTDTEIEKEIQARGLTAPRITPDDVEANIVACYYSTALQGVERSGEDVLCEAHERALSMITFCVMILRNGHRIVGVNTGPVSADNFNAELGRKLANQNAREQIWPLMGYALREQISRSE